MDRIIKLKLLHAKTLAYIFIYCIIHIGCKTDSEKVIINYAAGGYDYPTTLIGIDTNLYSYPIDILKGSKDSLDASYYGPYFGKGYKEPNLSLRYLGTDVFRLSYSTAFGFELIFSLTQDKIVVKEITKGSPYPTYDSTELSPFERFLFQEMKYDFPFKYRTKAKKTSRRIDSLTRRYPQLLDINYFRHLMNKSASLNLQNFTFITREINISHATYKDLVTRINECGYWKLPYELPCAQCYLDGFGYMLEANTATKYNCVSAGTCINDTDKFALACQAIIDAAYFGHRINLIMAKDIGGQEAK